MIKVLICDGEGTLQFPNPPWEMNELLYTLPGMGITLAVATNNWNKQAIRSRFLAAGHPAPDIIVTPYDVDDVKKPSPVFVRKVAELAGVSLSEIAFLGDDDNTDIFCAINAGVLPIAARYSTANKPLQYGMPAKSPQDLQCYLSTYGCQDAPYFGWVFNASCLDTGVPVDVRVLFGEHRDMGLTRTLRSVLKDGQDVRVSGGKVPVRGIIYHYLVSQIYLSGLASEIDWIATYPGHAANSSNALLGMYSARLGALFRQRFKGDLIVRHRDAAMSHATRGDERDIYEQFSSILVNPAYEQQIKGKAVLLLDDFTTSGSSLEAGRRMLMQAGARHVVAIAVGKFRNSHWRTRIAKPWNPFEPCTLSRADILTFEAGGSKNTAADDYFSRRIWSVFATP